MSVILYSPEMEWCPLDDPKIQANIERVMWAWKGTPYESGQRFIGRGADCIGAIFGIVDDLDGQSRAELPNLPPDAAMNDRSTAILAMRELITRYAPMARVRPDENNVTHVEPGDFVVTGELGGGPGHLEMVGARRNELWHCIPEVGFHQGGWSFFSTQVLWAVYRIQDKHLWTR